MYRIFSSYYGQMTTATTPEEAHELALMHLGKHLARDEQQDAKVTVVGAGMTYTIEKYSGV